jgi:hypothetical protein
MNVEQEIIKTTTQLATTEKKRIEYSCGCSYLFDHQLVLEHVCPEHEIELISFHG